MKTPKTICFRASITLPADLARRVRAALPRAGITVAEICRRALIRETERVEREARRG